MSFFDFFKAKPVKPQASSEEMEEFFVARVKELGDDKLKKMDFTAISDYMNNQPGSPEGYHSMRVIPWVNKHRLTVLYHDGKMSSVENTVERKALINHGELKSNVICKFCQTKGKVRMKNDVKASQTQTKGLGPLNSILLPKSETKTKVKVLRCENCEMEWEV